MTLRRDYWLSVTWINSREVKIEVDHHNLLTMSTRCDCLARIINYVHLRAATMHCKPYSVDLCCPLRRNVDFLRVT